MQRLIKILSFVRGNLLLFLIVGLALILRFARVTSLPPSLNWDEVSHGYNAYSILQTGKDEWGFTFPTIFRAYGDYKLPVYIYLTAVSEFFLGLNELAVRLPSVLAGALSVLFTYLLVIELTKKRSLGLVSAFLLAVGPWSLFLSRIAVEANLSLTLIISGVYFFLKGLRNSKFLITASILLGLSVWTYNSARIFVPLLLTILIFAYRKDLSKVYRRKKSTIHSSLFIILIFFLPMFWQLVNPSGQARYGWVEILDEGAIAQINEARGASNLPGILPTLVQNKATYFAKTFISNYFSHFSPEFLFFEGGSNYQFSVPGYGLLYSINLPFFLIGFFVIAFRIKDKRISLLVAFWFLLAPIASSLTREAPHVLRSIVFLPAPQIIISFGLISSYTYVKKRWKNIALLFVGGYAFVLLAQIESYSEVALFEYREKYSWSWQYGYKQVVEFVKQNYKYNDKVVVTKKYGEPHEFFLFYWPWEPEAYRNDRNLIRFYQSNWYWVDSFDKFYFVNDWQIVGVEPEVFVLESGGEVDCREINCLLITSPGNVPIGWNKVKTINFLNGEPAFEIHEN